MTERQTEIYQAWLANRSNYTYAAKALGVTRQTVQAAVRAVQRAQLGEGAPPEGWSPVKVTSDRHGKAVSVKSVPEHGRDHAPVVPQGHRLKGVTTLLDAGGSVRMQYLLARENETAHVDSMRFAAIVQALAAQPAAAPVAPPKTGASELANVVVFGDPHVGMLAQARETGEANWDLAIAEKTMTAALRTLFQRTPQAATCLLVNIGDFFHHQDNRSLTPKSGHKLDADCRFVKVAETGLRIAKTLVEAALARHETVTLANVPGNHDPDASMWLNLWCKAHFRDEIRLTILDNAHPYLYWSFGQNGVGLHHGHGAKLQKLPGIMAARDNGKFWGAHAHRRWITGHHHNYEALAFPGVLCEKFPTLAPLDYYAAEAGYRSERSVNAITLHAEVGEVGRAKVIAGEVEKP